MVLVVEPSELVTVVWLTTTVLAVVDALPPLGTAAAGVAEAAGVEDTAPMDSMLIMDPFRQWRELLNDNDIARRYRTAHVGRREDPVQSSRQFAQEAEATIIVQGNHEDCGKSRDTIRK